ncbi:SRPBCC family protein [Streptomyces sp. NPDC058542]|uniref:SRPBCC family protein n=1 Tax=Streptomyces sp. NPDC058542 TaxID=3346543 RepID=UPI0036553427
MGDYDSKITVAVPADRLFSYLADVKNLPAYMPRLTSARPHGGDQVTVTAHINPPDAPEQDVTSEAWVRVVEENKSPEWGAAGPHHYRGRLHVAPGDAASHSLLTVERTLSRPTAPRSKKALTGIKSAVENAEH